MEARLRLDDKVDADIIAGIKAVANNGPVSKALYRIVIEWYFLKKNDFVPKNLKLVPDQGESAPDQGQKENDLADVSLAIDKGW